MSDVDMTNHRLVHMIIELWQNTTNEQYRNCIFF